MPQAPDQFQPGFGYQEHPFWKALEGVVQGIRGMQTSKANPSLFHEPTVTASSAVGPAATGMGNVLADPRNAWMGIGPIAMAAKPMGWGAEVLRRYKLMGGDHKTLSKTLAMRGAEPVGRNEIVKGFRAGTDIAAPPYAAVEQNMAMEAAGKAFEQYGDGVRRYLNAGVTPAYSLKYMKPSDRDFADFGMESGSKGIAAYDAVSRQVGRMLDTPGFQFKRAQDLPAVSDLEYYKELPIPNLGTTISRLEELVNMFAGPNARPNVRRPRE